MKNKRLQEQLDELASEYKSLADEWYASKIQISNLQDEIARLALENSWGIVEIKPVSMTLEDIFLKLTIEEKETAA